LSDNLERSLWKILNNRIPFTHSSSASRSEVSDGGGYWAANCSEWGKVRKVRQLEDRIIYSMTLNDDQGENEMYP
jgi:hypothetical protein